MAKRYPLAPNPIFWSLQGEGHLRGFPMVFIRLAGCSVGCEQCDTNYQVDSHAEVDAIVERAIDVMPRGDRDSWVWITGGEPTDHDLRPLLRELKARGFSTALATSGVRRFIPPVDWLSVSPHSSDRSRFVQRYGSELKLIDGLKGLDIEQWIAQNPDSENDFMYRYVQPITVDGKEDPVSLARCLAFLKRHPRWALSRQDHIVWNVP